MSKRHGEINSSKPVNEAIVCCGLIGKKRAKILATDPESRLCAAGIPVWRVLRPFGPNSAVLMMEKGPRPSR
jgi:hypothetical protein